MEPRDVDGAPQHPPAWATEDVHIADPSPAWATHAEHYAAEIHGLLDAWLSGPVAHVGSTAVPGLAAKPIIDLQATAVDPAAAMLARQDALRAASWFFVPREFDQRPWRWFIVRSDDTGGYRLAHLHLMRFDEPRRHEQLAFRDALRADTALADEYALLKTEAAHRHRHDREAYTRAKQAFVQRVLSQGS